MMMTDSKFLIHDIDQAINYLFPINRSLTGEGNRKTLDYLQKKYLHDCQIKNIPSRTSIFDWHVPPEWNVKDAYVKNKYGKKIIDFNANNLHLMSCSEPFSGVLSREELLKKLHTLPNFPEWIPYRTSYYSRDWGFCCAHNLLESDEFEEPFEVKIDSEFNEEGELIWLEAFKQGKTDDEILISSYFCHPSLANDNLSGFVAATFLFKYLQSVETKFSYRLVIVPETIGAIAFLSQADTEKIVGGMVLSCVGGPGKLSIKEGFDASHWINQAAHYALNTYTDGEYLTYPFMPDGSDERQYSTPAFRIVTPSIHKSKYYEYDQYHTSADNLSFISSHYIQQSLDVYLLWINNIETYSKPIRKMGSCEYQLGKRDLYPSVGGTLNQLTHKENEHGYQKRMFDFDQPIEVNGNHLEAFHWLMHLADGNHTNFEIASRSKIDLSTINEAIELFHKKDLIGV
jgi:aminopeptidase-like protein